MMATSNKGVVFLLKQFAISVSMVIITLPGSHLLAGERAKDDVTASAMYKTSGAPTQMVQAAVEAETRIKEFFSKADFKEQLFAHFHGNQSATSAAWNKKAEELKSLILENKFNISIRLVSSYDINYGMSAFAYKGTDGLPQALINKNWLEYGITEEAMVRLIIEQTGFAMDRFLNGNTDTEGNEGKSFANDLTSIYEEPITKGLKSEILDLDGKKIEVELQP